MRRWIGYLLALLFLVPFSGCAAGEVSADTLPDLTLVTPPVDRWRANLIAPEGDPFLVAWEYRPRTLKQAPGDVDVLCPMWLYVQMAEGSCALLDLKDLGYTDFNPSGYVQEAHAQGTQVWATVVGFEPDATQDLLHSERKTQDFAADLAAYARAWDLDGINLDFENMCPADTDLFTALVVTLREALPDIVLSVCVTVPVRGDVSQNWYQSYDRGALAKTCDYLAVMTYDGHKEGVIAPVAGLDWVEYRLRLLLEEVPSCQVLLGVPFFGVDFIRDADTAPEPSASPLASPLPSEAPVNAKAYTRRMTVQNAQLSDLLSTGSFTVGEETFTLKAWAQQAVREEDTGMLRYCFTDTQGAYHTLYVEDESSLAAKGTLIGQYLLAGAAVWHRGLGTQELWQSLKDGMTP